MGVLLLFYYIICCFILQAHPFCLCLSMIV